MLRPHTSLAPLALVAATVACSDGFDPKKAQPTPRPGQTSFVSADGVAGQATRTNDKAAAPSTDLADGENDSNERTVEEGDIYRVSSEAGLIFNLNSFRGLQVIDVSDPTSPRIAGRVRLSGTPVEMYQVGDRLYMLLNNWYGYWGSRTDVRTEGYYGGLVVVADVSQPASPRITGTARVPGFIQTSRLTHGLGGEALFVVASEWNCTARTYVKSFDVSTLGTLTPKTEIDLGGWVTAIQASPDRLMVADYDWNNSNNRSTVTVIDISDPMGTMKRGASIQVQGYIASKFNMDMQGDVLRVVSGSSWNGGATNHLETFDARNIQQIERIDHETFGDNEQLFATLFLDDKAFCVTYERVDPFHAFAIDEAGLITPKSEYVVSGWNDFFKPVAGDQRLIGIGRNDQSSFNLAVSLYDISSLTLAEPLMSRQEVDLSWSWSEASWDDRAFSVLENATSIVAPTGELETGLVLLPFSGWDDQREEYVSAVQIFTFSSSTLTRRGIMDHGTQVRRSFVADPENSTTANLSEAELSLFDTRDPNAPSKLGGVELAPNYNQVLLFGSYAVRRKSVLDYYSWWGTRSTTLPDDTLEVVSRDGDVDAAAPIATVSITPAAQLAKLGDRLAVVSTVQKDPGDQNHKPVYTTTIELYSFANPTAPTKLGTLVTDELPLSYWGYNNYYPLAYADCFDCGFGWWGGYQPQIPSTDRALVFVDSIWEQQIEGTAQVRSIWPAESYWSEECYTADYRPRACSYYSGGITCQTLTKPNGDVQDEGCYGTIQRCDQDDEGSVDCREIDPDSIDVTHNDYSYERTRTWIHYELHPVDVGSDQPALGDVVAMDRKDESVGLFTAGSNLYLDYKQPAEVAGDSRPFVRYFFKKVDLSDPVHAEISGGINVPGELIAADGDTLITKDLLWGERVVESSIDRLTLHGDVAELDAVRRFEDRVVSSVQLDGGRALVTSSIPWALSFKNGQWLPTTYLSILDAHQESFPVRSTIPIDSWAQLSKAAGGRALFTVPGGVLVVNVEDPSAPFAQAFYTVQGWPSGLELEGDTIYFAAGRFGLYQLDAGTFNLLQD